DLAPFAFDPGGSECPLDHTTFDPEPIERLAHAIRTRAEPGRDLLGRAGTVRPCVARDEVVERPVDGGGERARHPQREGDAERVAEPGGAFGAGESLLGGDANRARATALQPAREHGRRGPVRSAPT